jgi:hypothetical protein
MQDLHRSKARNWSQHGNKVRHSSGLSITRGKMNYEVQFITIVIVMRLLVLLVGYYTLFRMLLKLMQDKL